MIPIFESIQARIAQIKEISYVDEDWGQLDYFENRPPVQWPCVLFTINDGRFSNLGRDRSLTPENRQQGQVTVEITVANLKLSNSSFNTPKFQKEHSWKIWNFIELIHKKLHGWRPSPTCGNLIRSSWKCVRRNDGIQEIHIIYTLGLNNI